MFHCHNEGDVVHIPYLNSFSGRCDFSSKDAISPKTTVKSCEAQNSPEVEKTADQSLSNEECSGGVCTLNWKPKRS